MIGKYNDFQRKRGGMDLISTLGLLQNFISENRPQINLVKSDNEKSLIEIIQLILNCPAFICNSEKLRKDVKRVL